MPTFLEEVRKVCLQCDCHLIRAEPAAAEFLRNLKATAERAYDIYCHYEDDREAAIMAMKGSPDSMLRLFGECLESGNFRRLSLAGGIR
jgi:hypothetical protein